MPTSPTSPMSIQMPLQPVKLPTKVLLSLSTAPVLCLLLGGRAVAIALQEIGQLSEEMFRGERLPILKITDSDSISDLEKSGS